MTGEGTGAQILEAFGRPGELRRLQPAGDVQARMALDAVLLEPEGKPVGIGRLIPVEFEERGLDGRGYYGQQGQGGQQDRG